jgi:hypothetical protein
MNHRILNPAQGLESGRVWLMCEGTTLCMGLFLF